MVGLKGITNRIRPVMRPVLSSLMIVIIIFSIFNIAFIGTSSARITTSNASKPYAYVTNWNSDTVSVIDTIGYTVVATVPVGNEPYAIVVSPDGNRVYVTNFGGSDQSVSVIDTATHTVIHTININSMSEGITVNPSGTEVYATGSNGINRGLCVIDTSDYSFNWTLNGRMMWDVATDPSGTYIYTTEASISDLLLVDPSDLSLDYTIPTAGEWSHGILVSPDSGRAYVTNINNDNISVIDLNAKQLLTNFTLQSRGLRMALDDTGSMLYVPMGYNNKVSVINTATGVTESLISTSNNPGDIAMSTNGQYAFVTCADVDVVNVISLATNTVVTSITVGDLPRRIAVNPNGVDPRPRVIGMYPISGTTMPISTPIFMVFNEDIDPSSVGTDNYQVSDSNGNLVDGQIAVQNGKVVYFNPDELLKTNMKYTVTIWDVTDTEGNSMMGESNFSFMTETLPANDGHFAYVTNGDDRSVSVIDLDDNEEVDVIDVGLSPMGVAITGDGSLAYVACSGDRDQPGIHPPDTADGNPAVYAIDTAAGEVLTAIELDGLPWAVGAHTYDGKEYVYVTSWGFSPMAGLAGINVDPDIGEPTGLLYRIDPQTNTVDDVIELGTAPTSITFAADGMYAYVTNFANGRVLPASYVGLPPFDMDNTVYVVDLESFTVVGSFTVGEGPMHSCTDIEGHFVYTANIIDGTVTKYDVWNMRYDNGYNLDGDSEPVDVAVSPEDSTMYVIGKGLLYMIDNEGHITDVLDLEGDEPGNLFDIDLDAFGDRAYVTDSFNDRVIVLSGNGEPIANISVQDYPYEIAINPAIDYGDPEVVSTTPANHATGVSRSAVISATFNHKMYGGDDWDEAVLINGIAVEDLGGNVAFDGYMVTYTPMTPLTAGQTYTVTIEGWVMDLAGTELGEDYVWSFTVASGTVPNPTPEPITTPTPTPSPSPCPSPVISPSPTVVVSPSPTPVVTPTATPTPTPTPTPEPSGDNMPMYLGILVVILGIVAIAGAAVYFLVFRKQ